MGNVRQQKKEIKEEKKGVSIGYRRLATLITFKKAALYIADDRSLVSYYMPLHSKFLSLKSFTEAQKKRENGEKRCRAFKNRSMQRNKTIFVAYHDKKYDTRTGNKELEHKDIPKAVSDIAFL